MNKNIKIGLVILGIVLVGGLIVLAFQNLSDTEEGDVIWEQMEEEIEFSNIETIDELFVSEEEITEKEIIIPLGSGSPIPEIKALVRFGIKEGEDYNTFNWYEYDGYNVGFSIEYRKDFEVSYGGIGDETFCPKQPYLVFISSDKKEIIDYGDKESMRFEIRSCVNFGNVSSYQEVIDYDSMGRYPVKNEENIVVAGFPAKKLTKTATNFIAPDPSYKSLQNYVYINKDEKASYAIRSDIDFEKKDTYIPIFEKMLSSFKFLD